ncbi:MAG: lipoprotein insertase outer membrane protein LolB, partial [Glaciecola sp.]
WIKGQVTDNVSDINYNQDGSVSSFTDPLSDWTVHYSVYQMSHGMLLPKQIELTSDKTRIKLRIDKWQLTQR